MHDMGADVDQGDVLVAAVGRKRRRDHHERFLGGVRLDVHDPRLEPGGIGDRHAVLDLFLARGGDQDFDFLGIVGRRSKDLEIEIDLVERKRDVLVGLGLDLQLQLLFLLAGRDDDLLGDDHGRGKRHGDQRLRLPRRFQPRFSASLTWSRLAMLPSVTVSLGSGSMAYRSSR